MAISSRANAARIGSQAVGPAGHTHESDPSSSGWQPMQVVNFAVASTTWVLDVGRFVNIVAINSANEVVVPGNQVYGPGTKITLTFSSAISGKIHCYS